jgi:hypothetical protein
MWRLPDPTANNKAHIIRVSFILPIHTSTTATSSEKKDLVSLTTQSYTTFYSA